MKTKQTFAISASDSEEERIGKLFEMFVSMSDNLDPTEVASALCMAHAQIHMDYAEDPSRDGFLKYCGLAYDEMMALEEKASKGETKQ